MFFSVTDYKPSEFFVSKMKQCMELVMGN